MSSERATKSVKRWFGDGEIARGIGAGLLAGLLILGTVKFATPWLDGPRQAQPSVQAPLSKQASPASANFNGHDAARDVRRLADWVARTGDAAGMEFILVDKKDAMIYVFDAAARLRASSTILIGAAVG